MNTASSKRRLSFIITLCLLLAFGLVPATAFAQTSAPGGPGSSEASKAQTAQALQAADGPTSFAERPLGYGNASRLNGIDVSSWQPANIGYLVDYDFMIAKSTQGTWYTNPYFSQQADSALARGKKLGIYHFADPATDPVAEARYFVDHIRSYIGSAIPFLDYEAGALNNGREWVRSFLREFKSLTSVNCGLYCSSYYIRLQSLDSLCLEEETLLWNANYWFDHQPFYAYDQSITPGVECDIYQYTSSGHLPGYDSALDLNVFYGTTVDWDWYTMNYTDQFVSEQTVRLAGGGGSRYKTMQDVVETFLENTVTRRADTLILAKGTDYPDALAASGLAGIYDAPIVITKTDSLSPEAAAVISAAAPSRIFVLGDAAGSLGQPIVDAVQALAPSASIKRLGGPTRYDTALEIYREGAGIPGGAEIPADAQGTDAHWSNIAIITRGDNFADALSVSPFAWATHTAVFLADPSTGLSAESLSAVAGGRFSKVYILGDENSIPDLAISQLAGAGIGGSARVTVASELAAAATAPVVRLAGIDRYHTSVLIAEESLSANEGTVAELGYNHTLIAKGSDFPDALSGGALAGLLGSTLVLVNSASGTGDHALNEYILRHDDAINHLYVLGDSNSISSYLMTKLDRAAR
ncbi:MAG: cell wall-binding repeat-containing protein [Coriobacteriales bacterium]|jgi:GH25 family lysozyme M1 (1,4-beta-N-acetylmuramidase)|nr:cell wall-binding repeat-containing protein [Coriobacteriales bacterium]